MWEDEDQKFDEELEQKHNALLMEDLYSQPNVLKTTSGVSLSKGESRSHEKPRESFDIDLSDFCPIQVHESPVLPIKGQNNNFDNLNDQSDIVCVDPSIEERKKSVRRSKSRLQKFKEMVDQSTSKHLSSIISLQVCDKDIHDVPDELKSIQISDSFSYLPINFTNNEKPSKLDLKNINEGIDIVKDKLRIDGDAKSCILLPKLKGLENYGIRAAVYDFIYMVDKLPEPKLEYFSGAFITD